MLWMLTIHFCDFGSSFGIVLWHELIENFMSDQKVESGVQRCSEPFWNVTSLCRPHLPSFKQEINLLRLIFNKLRVLLNPGESDNSKFYHLKTLASRRFVFSHINSKLTISGSRHLLSAISDSLHNNTVRWYLTITTPPRPLSIVSPSLSLTLAVHLILSSTAPTDTQLHILHHYYCHYFISGFPEYLVGTIISLDNITAAFVILVCQSFWWETWTPRSPYQSPHHSRWVQIFLFPSKK